MRKTWIILLLLALMAMPVFLRKKSPDPPKIYDLAVFNTIGRLSLWNTDQQTADRIAQEAIAALQQLHNALNLFDPDSELSHLNKMPPGEFFQCSEPLWQILNAAREAHQLTDGAFDITIGPLMKLWGFHRKRDALPTTNEIAEALSITGFHALIFQEETHSVAFQKPGMMLDFGGIAKGFALDYIRPIVEKHGCDCYLLNLGGNIYCSKIPPAGHEGGFQIGIRDPSDARKILRTTTICDQYISTSANYERALQIGERTIGHLLDPKTGSPVESSGSVTVITTRGAWSDAFSTAVFVRGKTLARQLENQLPGTNFIFLTE